MLIEINGEHTGSVVMFGTVAVQLLKMMGQSGNTEGAIRAPCLLYTSPSPRDRG